MKFSETTLSTAIKSIDASFAWKRENVYKAIDELTENNIAILGGDVWAVTKNNLEIPRLTIIDRENIAVGIIRGKDGQDNVYNWFSTKFSNEKWEEYVLRSKAESINAINKMNAENSVAEEFKNSIYYNLVYADQQQFEELIK